MANIQSAQRITDVGGEWLEFVIVANDNTIHEYRIPAAWSEDEAQRTLQSFMTEVDTQNVIEHAWVEAL